MAEVLVAVVRGGLAENLHRGDVAVVASDGRLLYRAGNPAAKRSYWRSAAKPFQAMAVVYSGAAQRFGLTAADLALMASSHNGEPVHTEQAAGLLQRIGLTAAHLQCGAHPPFDDATARAQAAAAQEPSALHSNCSGKHAGMLAVARHLGADLSGYLAPKHPVQRRLRENIAVCAGLRPWHLVIGVDGCGVPTFGLTVARMALAFARLAAPDSLQTRPGFTTAGMGAPDPVQRARAAAQVLAAMAAYPYLVAGRHRLDTELMQATGGRLVAKSGADGIYCVAVPPKAAAASPVLGPLLGSEPGGPAGLAGPATTGHGVGIAVKMEAGLNRYRELVVVEALRQMGLLTPVELALLANYGTQTLKNVSGAVVGHIHPVLHLHRAPPV